MDKERIERLREDIKYYDGLEGYDEALKDCLDEIERLQRTLDITNKSWKELVEKTVLKLTD